MARALAILAFCLGCVTMAGPAHAADDDPAARARAALRAATQRMRELEDQNATLQAKAAETDRAQQALTQKLAADEKELDDLRKQGDADKMTIRQTNSALASQRDSNAKLLNTYQETATTLQTRDAEAKRLDTVLGQARQRIQACETKNAALYQQAEEVLDLYDKRDLGDAIASSEPVTKLKRVEIENLMQDYEDKFRADKISQPAAQ
jgi:chromosome segregation ATPase